MSQENPFLQWLYEVKNEYLLLSTSFPGLLRIVNTLLVTLDMFSLVVPYLFAFLFSLYK